MASNIATLMWFEWHKRTNTCLCFLPLPPLPLPSPSPAVCEHLTFKRITISLVQNFPRPANDRTKPLEYATLKLIKNQSLPNTCLRCSRVKELGEGKMEEEECVIPPKMRLRDSIPTTRHKRWRSRHCSHLFSALLNTEWNIFQRFLKQRFLPLPLLHVKHFKTSLFY